MSSQSQDRESQRPRCSQCGTRRLRIRSGLLVCRHGHVQPFFRVELAADEFEDSNANTSRRRRKQPKTKRKRKLSNNLRSGLASDTESEPYGEGYQSDFTENDPRQARWYPGVGSYSLARGAFLRLQCLQMLYRMQIEAVKEMWELPSEWEAVAREVWAMLAACLPASYHSPQPLIAATQDWRIRYNVQEEHEFQTQQEVVRPYDAAQELALEKEALKDLMKDKKRKKKITKLWIDESDGWTSGGAGWTEDEEITQTEDDLEDPEDSLAALDPVFAKERAERRKQETTLEPEIQDEQKDIRPRGGTKLQTLLQLGTLPSTLSLIYLSLVKLQIPVLWKDLLDLISSHRLPYLEAVQVLPASLVQYLNSNDLLFAGLDSPNLPTITCLHERVMIITRLLQERYDVTFPELNASMMTCRLVHFMALPPRFYTATKRMMSFLGVSFHLHTQGRVSPYDGMRFMRNIPREAVIMATLLVVLKMEVGSQPDREWLGGLEKEQERPGVLDMDETEIDRYLDFAQRTLVVPNHPVIYAWRQIPYKRDWLAFMNKVDTTEDPPTAPATSHRPAFPEANHAPKLYTIFHHTQDRDATLPKDYQRLIEVANNVLGITRHEKRYPDDPVRKTKVSDNLERGLGIQNLVERMEEMLLAECTRRKRGREMMQAERI